MRLHRDVAQLLSTHGYTVDFSRAQSGGTYDTSTGTMTGGSTLTWSGVGVYINYTDQEINGTSITTDDRKLLLQAKDLTRAPENGDLVDSELQVISTRTIKSGTTVIGYVCQVRG